MDILELLRFNQDLFYTPKCGNATQEYARMMTSTSNMLEVPKLVNIWILEFTVNKNGVTVEAGKYNN